MNKTPQGIKTKLNGKSIEVDSDKYNADKAYQREIDSQLEQLFKNDINPN